MPDHGASLTSSTIRTSLTFFSIFTLTACMSLGTIRSRVEAALSGNEVGDVIASERKFGCAFVEFEYSSPRVLPTDSIDLVVNLGHHWLFADSISEIDLTQFDPEYYSLTMFNSALISAKNCFSDKDEFFRIVERTPGFVTLSSDGEAVVLIPADPNLPLVYLAGHT